MEFIFTQTPVLGAIVIFILRIINISLDTLRVLFMMRGKKPLVWILGFIEALIFVLVITSVLNHIDNPLNVIGYAAGFATGSILGVFIEERLAVGFSEVHIVSPRRGKAIADHLREEGYAVTEIPARGKDGMVSMLSSSVRRRQLSKVEEAVREIDEEAFVTVEDIRPVSRGFWRA
jgi:uncharacterized protein YebE (UPF0316 family)